MFLETESITGGAQRVSCADLVTVATSLDVSNLRIRKHFSELNITFSNRTAR
jgi:hypothetical protein